MIVGSVRFADAERAWLDGDAERCLALCDRVAPDGSPQDDALAVLRARALLRLRQTGETIALLAATFGLDGTRDASGVAALLLGTAHVRGGDVERGLALLHDASRRAAAAEPPIRSEIALGIALAHYQTRDFERAERALNDVDPASDVVYARALECRGWIAKCRNDFAAAVSAFEASLAQLDRCLQFDRILEANLVTTLSYIAVELIDESRWAVYETRAEQLRWESAGLEYYRFWMEMNRSMAAELAGRPRDALQAARQAAAAAPSSAFALFAQCRRAAVLFSYGELLGFEDLATSIRSELECTDLRLLSVFEEINLPVVVAETLALIGDGAGAAAALHRVETMSPQQIASLHDEPMKLAYLAFVEGLVADANSDAFSAQHRYRDALRIFSEIGMARRALVAALRLGELNGEPELLAFVEARTRALPAGSWIRTRAARLAAWQTDPLLADLTRADRAVLEQLHEGKSTAEIAAIRGRSPQTIRNTISKLLKTFSVDNRQALIKECSSRGAFPAPARSPRGGGVPPARS
jgi:DNA-binding CsgD family transcriptional regulator